MTFEYIAGFFDGEGWFSKRSTPEINASQASHRSKVLYEISAFLTKNGIKNSAFSKPWVNPEKPHWSAMHSLKITGRIPVIKFIRKVRPFLIVKSRDAEYLYRSVITKQWRCAYLQTERLERARRLQLSGMKVKDVTRKTGVSRHTLRKYVLKLERRGIAMTGNTP